MMDPWHPHLDDTATATPPHRWEEAGEAWGSRAPDWSCLYEHYSLDMLDRAAPPARSRSRDVAPRRGLWIGIGRARR